MKRISVHETTTVARPEGVLRITDTCVFLESAGGPEILVWPADRTRWNAESRSVTFTNFDDTAVTVGDGTPVVLGGGGDSSAESGVTPEAWLARIDWIARPSESCPLEVRWSVGALER